MSWPWTVLKQWCSAEKLRSDHISYHTTMNKLIFLVGCVSAAPWPAPDADGPPVYAPAPAYKKPVEELPPQPYQYQYGVADDYSKSAFDKVESQDEYGKVQGSYKINLPDGRVQVVNYVSDENGYQAEVSYEGEAQYPPPPPGGYGPYKGPGAYPGPKPGGYQ